MNMLSIVHLILKGLELWIFEDNALSEILTEIFFYLMT